jgi:LmbE family N-acetylglucosaminyl deacetylase
MILADIKGLKQGNLKLAAITTAKYFVPRILYYPSVHNRLRELPALVLDASEGREQKMAAIRAYRSQFFDNKDNQAVIKRVETDGEYWGAQINANFGEPLYSRDPVGFNPLALFPAVKE